MIDKHNSPKNEWMVLGMIDFFHLALWLTMKRSPKPRKELPIICKDECNDLYFIRDECDMIGDNS